MKAPAAPRIEDYYLPADAFFERSLPVGLTFDDISLATLYSEVLPRQTNLALKLSAHLPLQMPIISSDMDTVTESKMAIQMALNGGLGLIHYNMTDEQQAALDTGAVIVVLHGVTEVGAVICVRPDEGAAAGGESQAGIVNHEGIFGRTGVVATIDRGADQVGVDC